MQSDFYEVQEFIVEVQEKSKVTQIEWTEALEKGQNTLDQYYNMHKKFNAQMEKIINRYGYRGRRHLRIVEKERQVRAWKNKNACDECKYAFTQGRNCKTCGFQVAKRINDPKKRGKSVAVTGRWNWKELK